MSDTNDPIIVETAISPQHGIQAVVAGRLGRPRPFKRVKPDPNIIQNVGGHYVLTHPYVFLPTLAGLALFVLLTFHDNPQYRLSDWHIIGLFIFGAIFLAQYLYVVSNYGLVTGNELSIHYLTLTGRRGYNSEPLVNITNWNFDQHILQVPFKAGNLAPGVFGVREKRILRNIRFAKEVEGACKELAKRNKEKMERIERIEVGELRALNVLLAMLLEQTGAERESIVDRLTANEYPKDRAMQLFNDTKLLLNGGIDLG